MLYPKMSHVGLNTNIFPARSARSIVLYPTLWKWWCRPCPQTPSWWGGAATPRTPPRSRPSALFLVFGFGSNEKSWARPASAGTLNTRMAEKFADEIGQWFLWITNRKSQVADQIRYGNTWETVSMDQPGLPFQGGGTIASTKNFGTLPTPIRFDLEPTNPVW